MNKEQLQKIVFEALGEVSMCWSETPTGVFESTRANEIGNRIMKAFDEYSLPSPSTPQPLKADDPRVLINGFPVKVDFRIVSEDYYQKHFVDQPALQPLPEQMPEWFIEALTYLDIHSIDKVGLYTLLCQYFGTQPREWWMDLQKGDKFMYGDGIDGEIRTFNGHYSCIEDNYFLYSMEEGDSIGIGVGNCTPYTDPEAQLRKTLNPDQIKLLDEMKANTTP